MEIEHQQFRDFMFFGLMQLLPKYLLLGNRNADQRMLMRISRFVEGNLVLSFISAFGGLIFAAPFPIQ